MPHEFSVEFRIWGPDVDPDAITRTLGLQPCQTRLRGEVKNSRRWESGMWAFTGHDSEMVWTSLEAGIDDILSKLWIHRGAIEALVAQDHWVWWCGHFHDGFGGGPELSPRLMKRLGDFGARLVIDTYHGRTPP